jgi:hypothetical protein
MEEYINRTKLLQQIKLAANRTSVGEVSTNFISSREVVAMIIDAPAEDVVEMKHGYWIKDETYTGKNKEIYYCSLCNHWQSNKRWNPNQRAIYMNYCPQCGARMEVK